MKREYMKPYLLVESFQLDAAIAGACSGKITINQKVETCTLQDSDGPEYPGNPYFGDLCQFNLVDFDKENPDGPCYQIFDKNETYLTS